MIFSHKVKSSLFFSVGYALVICALFCVITSLVSFGMQRNEKKHPDSLLKNHGSISLFFLKMPSSKQKGYFVLGLTAGLISGICFGAGYDHEQKSKNQK